MKATEVTGADGQLNPIGCGEKIEIFDLCNSILNYCAKHNLTQKELESALEIVTNHYYSNAILKNAPNYNVFGAK